MPFISKLEHQRLLGIEAAEKQKEKNYKRNTRDLKRSHAEKLDGLEAANDNLDRKLTKIVAERDALKELKNNGFDNAKKQLELEARENIIDSRESNTDKREAALEKEESKHYKAGYMDGVADGLRKGYELTADDRRNMASIAALAAASHSDSATQTLANEIVQGMKHSNALPEGKKKS